MLSQEFYMGGGREAISLPCSRLKAIELRDWTRKVFDGVNIYHDIQIRELRTKTI